MDGEVMEGGWSGDDDDDGDDLPSPEAKAASRLALPEKNRGWRRLRDVDWKSDFCSGDSSQGVKIGRRWGTRGCGTHPGGCVARPGAGPRHAPFWVPPGCPVAPFGTIEASGTLIFNIIFVDFSSVPKYPETCTKENSTGISAENI